MLKINLIKRIMLFISNFYRSNKNNFNTYQVLFFLLTSFLIARPLQAEDFNQPDCNRLEQWTASVNHDESYSIAPEVKITALLKDELTRPLFGSTVEEWKEDQFRDLGKWLAGCRGDASKRKDNIASQNLYKAMKALRSASSTMRRAERMQNSAKKSVQELIEFPPAPGLPEVIAMAQDTLRGKDVIENVRSLTNREARMAATKIYNIHEAYGYLTEKTRMEFISMLDQTKKAAETEMDKVDEELQAAYEQLASAPFTSDGLGTVVTLSQLPVLDRVTPEAAREFRDKVQKKRWAIQKTLEKEKAEKAAIEAAKPIDIEVRLAELFTGKNIKNMSIRGLKPGMTKTEATRLMQNGWRYEYNAMGLLADMPWLPVRGDNKRYASERRDGGMADIKAMDNEVIGQIDFMEHYKGMVISTTPQAWLTEKFGKPDKVGGDAYTRLMTWEQGSVHLQVRVTSRLEVMWSGAGYKSQIRLSLWSDNYEKYLDKLNDRCADIRQKSRNELSLEESALYATKCPKSINGRLTPGI